MRREALPEGALYVVPDTAGLWLAVQSDGEEPAVKFHLAPAMVRELYGLLAWYLVSYEDEADADG